MFFRSMGSFAECDPRTSRTSTSLVSSRPRCPPPHHGPAEVTYPYRDIVGGVRVRGRAPGPPGVAVPRRARAGRGPGDAYWATGCGEARLSRPGRRLVVRLAGRAVATRCTVRDGLAQHVPGARLVACSDRRVTGPAPPSASAEARWPRGRKAAPPRGHRSSRASRRRPWATSPPPREGADRRATKARRRRLISSAQWTSSSMMSQAASSARHETRRATASNSRWVRG